MSAQVFKEHPYPWTRGTRFIGDSPNARVILDAREEVVASDYHPGFDLIWTLYSALEPAQLVRLGAGLVAAYNARKA